MNTCFKKSDTQRKQDTLASKVYLDFVMTGEENPSQQQEKTKKLQSKKNHSLVLLSYRSHDTAVVGDMKGFRQYWKMLALSIC